MYMAAARTVRREKGSTQKTANEPFCYLSKYDISQQSVTVPSRFTDEPQKKAVFSWKDPFVISEREHAPSGCLGFHHISWRKKHALCKKG